MQYEDLMGSSKKLMQKLAEEQLGPILQSMGVTEDPLEFFIDLLKVRRVWGAMQSHSSVLSPHRPLCMQVATSCRTPNLHPLQCP